jgi:hypothetical protein
MIFNETPKAKANEHLQNAEEIALAAGSAFCECTGIEPNEHMVQAIANALKESFKSITVTAHGMTHLSNQDKDFVVFCSGITSGAGLAGQAPVMSQVLGLLLESRQATSKKEGN